MTLKTNAKTETNNPLFVIYFFGILFLNAILRLKASSLLFDLLPWDF